MNLIHLGWTPAWESCLTPQSRPGLLPARVARHDRLGYVLYTERRALRATVSGAMRHAALDRAALPVVGDWVAIRPRDGGSAAQIHALLPRRSFILRWGAGNSGEQPIAANIDYLLICMGLDSDFNVRRLERYLALAHSGGVRPVVVLNKADVCADLAPRVAAVESAAIGAPVLVLSALHHEGLEALRPYVAAGLTAALVGSSGVGKSTIINALLGDGRLRTNAVRAHDGRGRHTTTARELLPIPDAGVIIDTPGMRALAPAASADDLEVAFSDLAELAASCRFRDCEHQTEPGCAIQAAIQRGELGADRLENYRKLLRDQQRIAFEFNPLARAEHKARWKALHKAARRRMRDKYGSE
ncbi:MAG: putative ribosome biogenesis GTPase RsgA [Phycisphaerae bacterium]|nr:putative ribosome biogenesis GTPase RsgA [Phycisphaerae bacterium]